MLVSFSIFLVKNIVIEFLNLIFFTHSFLLNFNITQKHQPKTKPELKPERQRI